MRGQLKANCSTSATRLSSSSPGCRRRRTLVWVLQMYAGFIIAEISLLPYSALGAENPNPPRINFQKKMQGLSHKCILLVSLSFFVPLLILRGMGFRLGISLSFCINPCVFCRPNRGRHDVFQRKNDKIPVHVIRVPARRHRFPTRKVAISIEILRAIQDFQLVSVRARLGVISTIPPLGKYVISPFGRFPLSARTVPLPHNEDSP